MMITSAFIAKLPDRKKDGQNPPTRGWVPWVGFPRLAWVGSATSCPKEILEGNTCTLQRLSLWYPKGILVVPEGFVLGVGAGDEGAVGMIKHRVGCLLEDMLLGVCTVVPLCFH